MEQSRIRVGITICLLSKMMKQSNEGQFGEDHTRQISCSSGDSMPLFEHVSEREHITLRTQEYVTPGLQQYVMDKSYTLEVYQIQQNGQSEGRDVSHYEQYD